MQYQFDQLQALASSGAMAPIDMRNYRGVTGSLDWTLQMPIPFWQYLGARAPWHRHCPLVCFKLCIQCMHILHVGQPVWLGASRERTATLRWWLPAGAEKLKGPDTPPKESRKHNPPVAAKYLGYMTALCAIAVALHFTAILAWQSLRWTKDKPLPEFLFFPAPELLLLNTLALPGTMYAMLLLVGAEDWPLRLLGAASMLLLLIYLAGMGALSAWLALNKDALGLEYQLFEAEPGLGSSLRQRLTGLSSFPFASTPIFGSTIASRAASLSLRLQSGRSQQGLEGSGEQEQAQGSLAAAGQAPLGAGTGAVGSASELAGGADDASVACESKRSSSSQRSEAHSLAGVQVRGSHGFWRPPIPPDYEDLRRAGDDGPSLLAPLRIPALLVA
jgi:hypothetical protein